MIIETSIIVPSYNSELTIKKTLNSIISQKYVKWECIIIDDFSNDNSVKIIEEICDKNKNFKLIKLLYNQGVSNARNVGIDNSKGKYICFLDSDDFWSPYFLEKSIKFLKNTDCKLTYSTYKRFFDSNPKLFFNKFPPKKINRHLILTNNHIPMLTAVLDKDILKGTRFVKERFEDYIFWLQIFSKNPDLIALRVGKEALASYRISNKQRSANKIVNILRAYVSYRKYLGNSLILSFFRTFVYTLNSLIDYLKQYLNIKI